MRNAIARDEISISPLLWVIKFKILTYITFAWHWTTVNQPQPSTDEKYLSMTFGVLIDTSVTEKGKTVKIYEYLLFIHSFKMMNSSLEKLVEISPDDCFEIMKAMFSTLSDANLQLPKQKGYYPYSYVTGRSKFSDTSLPPLSKWGNTLDRGAVKVTETNLQHARRMWEILECGKLQDYHDSYLKLHCALLACVCKFHRKLSFDSYKLDCMHFFTLPNLDKEASLRICKANVELLTEREHLDMLNPQFAVESHLSLKVGASLQITPLFSTTIARRNPVLVTVSTLITFMVA